MASKREWNVPEYTDPTDPIPVDREEAAAAFLEAEAILHRMGGAMIIVPRRVETADSRFFTAGYAFRHESYAPAVRQAAPDPEPDPDLEALTETQDLEPEPVA